MSESKSSALAKKSTVFLLFLFFFFVITAFWTLKPLRTAGVVKAVGPDWYPLVKQGTLLLIPLVMVAYEMLTNRLGRASLVSTFTLFFAAGGVAFWAGFQFMPGVLTKVAFFYYVDIYITVMVTLFWSYLNSLARPEDAKKYYGLIGSGGLIGGILGSLISGWLSETLGNGIILLSTVFLAGVMVIITLLERGKTSEPISTPSPAKEKPGLLASSTEGVRLVWRSSYLMGLVAVVGIYEIVSSVIDYQFNASCNEAFADQLAMAAYQGKVFSVAQVLSLVVMVFVTPVVHKRLGMFAGLIFLPAALLAGSAAFIIVPVLAMITATVGAETTFAYSIQQASKEILYVPLDNASKFKAKAFIDMFVFRFAKALGGVFTLAFLTWIRPMGIDNRYLIAVNALLIAGWVIAIRSLAREFTRRTAESPAPEAAPRRSAAG